MNFSAIISGVGVFICFFLGILVIQICRSVMKLSKPERAIQHVELSSYCQATIESYYAWLTSVQLEHRATLQVGAITVAVFQQKGQARYFSFMFHQRITCGVESYLKDLTILDTSNSGTPDLFPRPGAYKQSFSGASPEELWERHLQGEAQLAKKFGYQWEPIDLPYETLLADAIRIRMKHVRSQPLWPLKVLLRYFVTGRGNHDRSIAEQFP